MLFLTISLCLHPVDSSIAGDCSDKGTGAGTQTVSGNYNYAPGHTCAKDPDIEYDTANSNETIDRNGSAALFVTGDNGPFTWSVSGVGFTLETENEPTGATNTLYADGSACGAATITVTGCDGEEVKGYVRCTIGFFALIESCQKLSACAIAGCRSQSNRCELIQGKYKYVNIFCYVYNPPDCSACIQGDFCPVYTERCNLIGAAVVCNPWRAEVYEFTCP